MSRIEVTPYAFSTARLLAVQIDAGRQCASVGVVGVGALHAGTSAGSARYQVVALRHIVACLPTPSPTVTPVCTSHTAVS